MIRKIKTYLILKRPKSIYQLEVFQKMYLGKNGFVPYPLWEWYYIFGVYTPRCLTGILNFFNKIYFKYIKNHWAKKHNLEFVGGDASDFYDSIEIDPKYEDTVKYYLSEYKKKYDYHKEQKMQD